MNSCPPIVAGGSQKCRTCTRLRMMVDSKMKVPKFSPTEVEAIFKITTMKIQTKAKTARQKMKIKREKPGFGV